MKGAMILADRLVGGAWAGDAAHAWKPNPTWPAGSLTRQRRAWGSEAAWQPRGELRWSAR